MKVRRLYASLFFLIVILMLMTSASVISPAYGKITAKSVWYTVDSTMVRTKDIFGNKFSLACENNKYAVYLTLVNNVTTTTRSNTYVTLYINRKTRIKYKAYVSGDTLIVDLKSSYALIRDMKDSLDVNAFIEGGRGTDIMAFALDGFSGEFNRTCR